MIGSNEEWWFTGSSGEAHSVTRGSVDVGPIRDWSSPVSGMPVAKFKKEQTFSHTDTQGQISS